MNRENYVSLEVAKQLDDKGFRWLCHKFYLVSDGDDGFISYPKPTLYIFQKWLREKKNIHISIEVCESGYFSLLFMTNGSFFKNLINQGPNEESLWDTYEEALDAAIIEALKTI